MSKTKTPRRKQQLIIDNPKTAQILLSDELTPHLMVFSGRAKTIRKVALELNMTIKDLHYYVGKLCAHNLLEVARTKSRAGRPIKYYRTSAIDFIIPYKVSKVTSPKEFAEIVIEGFFEIFYQSFFPKELTSQVGIKVHIKDGEFSKFFAQEESKNWHDQTSLPKPYDLNAVELRGFYLSEKEAIALQQDLLSVLNNYKRGQPQDSSQKLFLSHWGLVKALEKPKEEPSKEVQKKSN